MLDVAKRANVALSTVSYALNGTRPISEETRQRIFVAMEELGYRPHALARGLASGRSRVVGVLVPDLGTGYIGEIIRGIDDELDLAHYDLMLYTTHRREAKESGYVATLTQGLADGLLIVLPRNPATFMQTLQQRNFPYVLIDHQGTNEQDHAVGATNWQGAYSATEYLIRQGHQRIGFITGSMDFGCARDRLAGYQAALQAHHLSVDPELVYEGDFHQPEGYAGGNALLSLAHPPTAIFASNDVMAMGVIDAVRSRGLRIPDDISILGFDDIPQAQNVRPALTTVRQPLEKMGRVATQMLLDLLNDPHKDVSRVELPTELVIRDSCPGLVVLTTQT
jgi:LacI family transcriptional regulator